MNLVVPIVLLIVGLAFVVAEVFFVSMGLLSLIAGICILAADVLAFQVSATAGWILVAVEVVFVPLLIWLAFRWLPRLPFGQRMMLEGPVTPPAGGFPSLDHLMGRKGEALTDLRPSGSALIEGERVSVVALGTLVPRGSEVQVVMVQGTEVRVRPTRVPEDDDGL